jgi:hypothetical protein
MDKRSQTGSAGLWVLIVVVGVLLYWQWDWISDQIGIGGGGGSLELVDYRCDRGSFDGTVRNASESPVSIRAVTAIYDSSGKKSDYKDSPVRPSPVQPGQSGGFRGDTGALPDGGYCKLDGFVNSDTGKPVRYTGRRR